MQRTFQPGKRIRLTDSEIRNHDTTYNNGTAYTIIRRLQQNGSYLVAAVTLNDRAVLWHEYAVDRSDVRRAVHEVQRWLDKMGYLGGRMSHVSRHRHQLKQQRKTNV